MSVMGLVGRVGRWGRGVGVGGLQAQVCTVTGAAAQ